MIEVRKLTKIYKSKYSVSTKALDDISLKLPNKGLVFVVGKSGSGKSTLLNIIAGLDKQTSGDVFFHNVNITRLSKNQLCDYRAREIGFIFQYYHLIDNLTVKENILISNQINNENNISNFDYIINELEISNILDKYPTELSGGQRQRVGIARTLIKNPKFILCDEPTGNLDKANSLKIMSVLKEVSKERLVVVVSHNSVEADLFADRIIELEAGKILKDNVRKSKETHTFFKKGDTLYLPHYRNLTEEEIDEFSSYLTNNEITNIVQQNNGFAANDETITNKEKIVINKAKFGFKNRNKHYPVFFKKRLKSMFITAFIATFLMIVISILGSILNENYKTISHNSKLDHVILTNTTLNPQETSLFHAPIYPITNREFSKLRSLDYDGKTYKLYNEVIYSHIENTNLSIRENTNVISNVEELYIKEPFGVLAANETFIKENVAKNNQINLLAGSLTGPSYGVIITDYLADSIIHYYGNKYPDYDSILGYLDTYNRNINSNITSYIIGIVETDYKLKYNNIVKEYDNVKNKDDALRIQQKVSKFSNYNDFLNDVLQYYGIGYSINPKYETHIGERQMTSVSLDGLYFNNFKNEYQYSTLKINNSLYSTSKEPIREGEIHIPYQTYNKIFNTNYNASNITEFKPVQIEIKTYDNNNQKNDIIYRKTYTVSSITSSSVLVHYNDFKDFIQLYINPYCVYLDNTEKVETVINEMQVDGFYCKTIDSEKVVGVSKILNVFIPFFKIIYVVLYVILLVFLLINTINNVKSNYYEIGVYNALGVKIKDIRKIYIRNLILTGLVIFIISYAISPIILYVADIVLKLGFENLLSTKFVEFSIIDNFILHKRIDIIVVFAMLFASLYVINIYLNRIRPIELISKNKKEV